METRTFGSIRRRVAVIGQGTWEMEHERAAAIAALRRGLDAGLSHIDTAEMYGDGKVEALIGEAIAGRRDEVFLTSKLFPKNASRRRAARACEKSLKRLGTDRLDLYLIHWHGDQHPLEETVAGFEALREAGKILAWGVSNFSPDELGEIVEIAGPGRVACNQVFYHLGERTIEHELIPLCKQLGIAVVGYSPFGSGDFPASNPVLNQIAAAHGASPRQVALRFLVRDPNVFAIPKAARVEHVLDNAGAIGLALSADEIARIDRAFPVGPRRKGIATN